MKRYLTQQGDPESAHAIHETAFQSLMQKRIFNVLLIASPYDTFMLEEDGRVEEQVYFEYVNLNLSSPPRFTKSANFQEARDILAAKNFDLIIAMPGVDAAGTFAEIRELRTLCPKIPFVLLTPFSKEVSRRLANEDLSVVDYVFSWLGNVELILAIIKLIEDKMNAEHDVLDIGVRSILLVEDSIRFYSAILPHIYKFLLRQSMVFSTEALNDHERMLRMRGRPKVLFARDYEEAVRLFDKYGEKMLGIISDVRFPRAGRVEAQAGLDFIRRVREKDPYIPVIIESSELSNEKPAQILGARFLDKNSKILPQNLRIAVLEKFSFGDFVISDPDSGLEILRIHNLKDLQKNIFNIPVNSLYYHCASNGISRWLYSRALFAIGDAIRSFRFTDLSEAPAVRQLVFDSIARYRRMRNRGVVAIFHKDRYDQYSNFARIGEGSMGGKGRGIAFIDHIIKKYPEFENYMGAQISIPRTIVICTDIFDEFMESNRLYPTALSNIPDQEILNKFLKADLPSSLIQDFNALFDVIEKPVAVRSSSLLEDSHYQPFAGVYSTYMIPRSDDRERSVELLCEAVKGVYASVFFSDSKAYMNATRNLIDQEKMAVIIQEVVGSSHGDFYYPVFSGVGRSLNYYPIGDERVGEGVAEVAAGLGKYIVDGGMALRFSPDHPGKAIQTSTLQTALRDTQTYLDALPISSEETMDFSPDDGFNIRKIPISEAAKDGSLRFIVSTYDANDGILRDTDSGPGRKVVTFANLLKHNVFPLAQSIKLMLETGQYEMGRPVEIEFAGELNPDALGSDKKGQLYWLQIRPIVDQKEMLDDSIMAIPDSSLILRAGTALGHGIMDNVCSVVYVRPQKFDSSHNRETASEIENINRKFTESERPYILIGPGRWGSSDPALGIPVRWSQICGARLIAEASLPGYRIEPSQGTHFFQNLTSFGVGYFTLDPSAGQGYYDIEYLDSLPAEYESDTIRIVTFDSPLKIAINGRKSQGVVIKPGE